MPVLPVSEAFAFRAPVVNGDRLVLPILIDGTPPHTHGFRGSILSWRAAANEILRATAPDRLERSGPGRPSLSRGAITIVVGLVLLLLGALGMLGAKHISDARAPAKLQAKQQAVTDAQVPVLKGVQENVHKAQVTLSHVPDSRAKQLTQGFLSNAGAGIDQVVGPPSMIDTSTWQDLCDRLLSDNAAIRSKADADNAAAEGRISDVSSKLASVTADRDEYQRKFNEQAAAAIELQAKIRKYMWVAGAIFALWLIGQILARAAQANPVFEGVSSFVNSVVSPGVHSALSDAKQTIEGVGKAIGVVKSTLAPDAAAALASNIAAAVPNQSHVAKISNATSAISALSASTQKTP